MQKRNLFSVLIIVLILVMAAAGYFLYKKPLSNDPAPAGSQSPSISQNTDENLSPEEGIETEINFSKEGNLTKGPSELGDEGWFITYEEPGKPALRAELIFDEMSVCTMNGTEAECGKAEFTQGLRVRIEGDLEENFLFVSTLKTIDSASKASADSSGVGIANPASTYCLENGGELEMRTDAEGSQVGYCKLSSGKECEEWAYFRGECK